MNTQDTPANVSRLTAFWYWLKLGFISFGGPAGQIAMMHQELVEKRRWISERRFLHALNYTMVLPGPEAQQLATYMGWLMHGTFGGIVAGTLFVLPSLLILIALTWAYLSFGHLDSVAGILYGIKPAVVAIVLFAAYRIGMKTLRHGFLMTIALAAFVGLFVFHISFPYIIITAAVIGWVGHHFIPDAFKASGGHGVSGEQHGKALIDDDTPPPSWVAFSWASSLFKLAVGLMLWLLVEGALYLSFGWQGPLTQMGWFFTKAALVTFGGAYAVLPYVYQGGVNEYQWLSATQMMDGLALGETTSGPLIMIVTFIGFVGGWTKELFGPEAQLLAGAAGASVATLFTFLPSFIFVLIGAPLVERTRNDMKLSAPLTAITAAVVGVIVNLATFFAWHVFLPQGTEATPFAGSLDLTAIVIALVAFFALSRFKQSVIRVIGASAIAGLVIQAVL
jgi:chromate transporter